ncbi:hypothetical protein J3F83DRAFT_228157 [Trichoderma novae-zelandiae]
MGGLTLQSTCIQGGVVFVLEELSFHHTNIYKDFSSYVTQNHLTLASVYQQPVSLACKVGVTAAGAALWPSSPENKQTSYEDAAKEGSRNMQGTSVMQLAADGWRLVVAHLLSAFLFLSDFDGTCCAEQQPPLGQVSMQECSAKARQQVYMDAWMFVFTFHFRAYVAAPHSTQRRSRAPASSLCMFCPQDHCTHCRVLLPGARYVFASNKAEKLCSRRALSQQYLIGVASLRRSMSSQWLKFWEELTGSCLYICTAGTEQAVGRS